MNLFLSEKFKNLYIQLSWGVLFWLGEKLVTSHFRRKVAKSGVDQKKKKNKFRPVT